MVGRRDELERLFVAQKGVIWGARMSRPWKLGATVASVAVLVIGIVAFLQLKHSDQYGHFFALGLHVDVFEVSDFSEARENPASRLYEVVLTNYSLLPAKILVEAVAFEGRQRIAITPFWLQVYDGASGEWAVALRSPDSELLEGTETAYGYELLWPGQSIGGNRIALAAAAERAGVRLTEADPLRILFAQWSDEKKEEAILHRAIVSETFQIVH
jgi:hypothetical protein